MTGLQIERLVNLLTMPFVLIDYPLDLLIENLSPEYGDADVPPRHDVDSYT